MRCFWRTGGSGRLALDEGGEGALTDARGITCVTELTGVADAVPSSGTGPATPEQGATLRVAETERLGFSPYTGTITLTGGASEIVSTLCVEDFRRFVLPTSLLPSALCFRL